MYANAASFENAAFRVCSALSASQASSPTRSGRWLSVWPTLTLTGPSDAIASRSMPPRVRRSGAVASSASQASRVRLNVDATTPRRFATTRGRSAMKPRIFSRSNSPRSCS